MSARAFRVTQPSPEDQHRAWISGHRYRAQHAAESFPASIASAILEGWDARLGQTTPANGSPVAIPNAWARERTQRFKAAHVHRAYDEARIRDFAENYAMCCSVLIHSADHVPVPMRGTPAGEQWRKLSKAIEFAESVGVVPVTSRRATFASMAARMICATWWRRQLRKAWTRSSDDGQREVGQIRKGREPYVSDAAVTHRAARQRRTREWGNSRVMVSDDGEQLEMLPLMDRSIANPAIRRTELMVRCRGFEELAQAAGQVADFWVLTTPSRFHAQLHHGGENPTWQADRATVRDGQMWLRRMWAKARAKLARLSVQFNGMRTVEPHHDGTPHWNLLVFGSADALKTIAAVIRGLWLSDCGDEPGAQERRVRVTRVDPSKGSATGYIAKYISKNLDGAGAIGDAISDETGNAVTSDAQRVAAWASVHGIRQFQQVGGPPVGKWRELRRLREPVEPEWIEAVRAAADRNSWADYARNESGVEFVRETIRDGITSRAACAVNRYGEQGQQRIVGLRDWDGVVVTRPHRWRIEKKCASTDGAPRGTSHAAAAAGSCRDGNSSTATNVRSDSSPGSRLFSDLGPVAIIVRKSVPPPDGSFAWVMTVPFKAGESFGDPAAWTGRETSMAGPQ